MTAPGELNLPARGFDSWLQYQLDRGPGQLPPAVEAQVAAMRISQAPMERIVTEEDVKARAYQATTDPAERSAGRDAYQSGMASLANEARHRFILRALYSGDQVREQMTWFWFNHFNVQSDKRDIRAMLGNYEDMLRAKAFGRFRDLLESTLRHPAMLRYLDSDQNTVGHTNENYARELLELHSMGIGSGYTQKDVEELARILTGIRVNINSNNPTLSSKDKPYYVREGLFEFNPAQHDFGDKTLLGHAIKGGGIGEIEKALDILAKSPATASHISTQIAIYFMGDTPSRSIINRMATTFMKSDGDIKLVLRALFMSQEFHKSLGRAFKDPVHYVISAVRISQGDRVVINPIIISNWITSLGERLYSHEAPNGYEIDSAAWSGPGQLARRFDIARQIANGAPDLFGSGVVKSSAADAAIKEDVFFRDLRSILSKSTIEALDQSNNVREKRFLFLSSPEFMKR